MGYNNIKLLITSREGRRAMKLKVNHIKALIAEKGLNVTGFCANTNIPYSTVNGLLNGSRSGNLKTIGRIAKALEVNVTEIIED